MAVTSVFTVPTTVTETPLYQTTEVVNTDYWSLILWSVYGIGLLLFGSKFIRNLWSMIVKVQQNPKYLNKKVTYVLLDDKVTPHTFLRYIFFNKHTFEYQRIPKEVIWHEETHAKQRHSIDIILIEALQVILWFNPLLYITKASIKLNHEFFSGSRRFMQRCTTFCISGNFIAIFYASNSKQIWQMPLIIHPLKRDLPS